MSNGKNYYLKSSTY